MPSNSRVADGIAFHAFHLRARSRSSSKSAIDATMGTVTTFD